MENNSVLSTSQKRLEENDISYIKYSDIKNNSEEKVNSITLLQYDIRSAYIEKNNQENIILNFIKSNSYILQPSKNFFKINDNSDIIQDKQNNSFNLYKAKSQKNYKNINPNNLYINYNTNLQGRLETVVETISEVSHSKKDSKDIFKNNETKNKFNYEIESPIRIKKTDK